jgi:hypothetical protein
MREGHTCASKAGAIAWVATAFDSSLEALLDTAICSKQSYRVGICMVNASGDSVLLIWLQDKTDRVPTNNNICKGGPGAAGYRLRSGCRTEAR